MSVYNIIQRNAVPSLLVPSLPYMVVHVMAEGTVASRGDNINTTQTPECSKGKYNATIINESLSEGLTNNLCRPKARNKKEVKGING
jgi:hypothetical protein